MPFFFFSLASGGKDWTALVVRVAGSFFGAGVMLPCHARRCGSVASGVVWNTAYRKPAVSMSWLVDIFLVV